MKTAVAVLTVAGCCCLGYFTLRPRVAGTAAPAIHFPQLLDLGGRDQGEVVTANFRIDNQGGEPLEIDQIRACCSCAGVEREVDGRRFIVERLVIPPGDGIDLLARVSVRGLPGRDAKSVVSFRTNDPSHPQCEMVLLVPKILGIACSPTAVLFDGTAAGQERTATVEVRNVGTGSPKIVSTECNVPGIFSASIVPPVQNGSNETIGRIQVTLLPQKPGSFSGEMTLTVQSGSQSRKVVIPISAIVVPPATASPAFVSLPRASGAGDVFEFTCAIRGYKGTAITVSPAAIPPDFSVEVLDSQVAAPVKTARIRWAPPPQRAGESFPKMVEINFFVRGDDGDHTTSVRIECAKLGR